MKKLALYMLAALGIVAACTREEAPRTVETHESNAATITVMAGKAGTRTWMTEDGSGFQFKWKKGDKIAIEEGVATSSGGDSETYISKALDVDMEEGLFTVSLGDRDLSGSQNLSYTAVYPAAVDGWGRYNQYGQLHLGIFFPMYQYPSADCFDPDADVLVSQEVIRSDRPGDGDQLTFRFARVGTIVKMVLNGLPEGWVLKDGVVDFEYPVSYYAEYYPAEMVLTDNDGSENIYFDYTGRDGDKPGITIGPDRSAVVWLRCLSGKTGRISVSLNQLDFNGHYARSRRISLRAKGQKMEFKEGGLTTFTVNFAPADVENPDQENVHVFTNPVSNGLTGLTVSWPASDDKDLDGYEAFLMDEDDNRHEFDQISSVGDRWEAVISQEGLSPGEYSLFVRAQAVEHKVSQPDYLEHYFNIGYHGIMAIGKSSFELDYTSDVDREGWYYNNLFGYRNLFPGSFETFSGTSYQKTWAIWNKTPMHLDSFSVLPYDKDGRDFQLYVSDEPFVDGIPSGEPLNTYTLDDNSKRRDYQIDGQFYFLLTSNQALQMRNVAIGYYN